MHEMHNPHVGTQAHTLHVTHQKNAMSNNRRKIRNYDEIITHHK